MGIETYEEALGGSKAPKGEELALAESRLVASDETLIRRFWGFQFHDENGDKAADSGFALIVTDKQLIVLKEGGFLKKKFKTLTFPYGDVKENVARSEFSAVPGSKPYYVAGFGLLHRGSTACVASFFEEQDRDAFAAVLQAALDAHSNGVVFSPQDLAQLRALLR